MATPISNMTVTWNNAGTTYNAIKMNVMDNASNAASNLMDLQLGGTSQFKVSKAGQLSGTANVLGFSANDLLVASYLVPYNNIFGVGASGTINFLVECAVQNVAVMNAGMSFGWGSQANASGNGSALRTSFDLKLFRDNAANTLAQRNATNAQTFRVYNTYTDASNYERLSIAWTGSIAYITTAAAGTGVTRALNLRGNELYLSGSTAGDQWYFQSTGNLLPIANNTYNIGNNSSSRVRTLFLGTSLDLTGGAGAAGDIVTATGSVTVRAPSQGGSLVFAVNEAGTNRFQVAQAFTSAQGAYALGANSASPDVFINREAADVLSQYRSTNPQTFRVYNTFTDASNYERGIFSWSTNQLQIGTESAGTGAARDLYLVSGSGNIRIGRSGGNANLIFFNDNTADIGASGANRPRTIYVGSNIVLPTGGGSSVQWEGRSRIYGGSTDGVIALSNAAFTDFGRLQFGGTTSSFPALKRVGANLQTVGADDTATAGLIVGNQALATTATDGFLYVPTCAGTPTGTPTARTGTVPIVVDTTNNKLYFYSGAAWRDAGP